MESMKGLCIIPYPELQTTTKRHAEIIPLVIQKGVQSECVKLKHVLAVGGRE